jgi:hypothetical protein
MWEGHLIQSMEFRTVYYESMSGIFYWERANATVLAVDEGKRNLARWSHNASALLVGMSR